MNSTAEPPVTGKPVKQSLTRQWLLRGANMKIVISDTKTGKTYQREVPKERSGELIGMKIGSQLDGGIVGAAGFKLEITGGSDKEGFPMRKGVRGAKRSKLLLSSGPGFRPQSKGELGRRGVRGEQISDEITQLNCKIVEWGSLDLATIHQKSEGKKR